MHLAGFLSSQEAIVALGYASSNSFLLSNLRRAPQLENRTLNVYHFLNKVFNFLHVKAIIFVCVRPKIIYSKWCQSKYTINQPTNEKSMKSYHLASRTHRKRKAIRTLLQIVFGGQACSLSVSLPKNKTTTTQESPMNLLWLQVT